MTTLRRRELPRRREETGSAALEIAILAPVLVAFLLFVIGMGRIAHARQELQAVAEDSARAASLQRDTSLSDQAAQSAARASLGEAHVSCDNLVVHVDLSSYEPGGHIRVAVSCHTKLSDLAMAGFPGGHTFTATATVPIETTRGS